MRMLIAIAILPGCLYTWHEGDGQSSGVKWGTVRECFEEHVGAFDICAPFGVDAAPYIAGQGPACPEGAECIARCQETAKPCIIATLDTDAGPR
jgi:hypothetical protein